MRHLKGFNDFVNEALMIQDDGGPMTTPGEKALIRLLIDHGIDIDVISRKSDKEYDLYISCPMSDNENVRELSKITKNSRSGLIAWLPIAAIRVLASEDSMDEYGGWNEILDSTTDTVWFVFHNIIEKNIESMKSDNAFTYASN